MNKKTKIERLWQDKYWIMFTIFIMFFTAYMVQSGVATVLWNRLIYSTEGCFIEDQRIDCDLARKDKITITLIGSDYRMPRFFERCYDCADEFKNDEWCCRSD